MDATDKLIRGIYAIALEGDWGQFRALALEQAVRQLGAAAGAWLTQPDDMPGEFNAWPAQATVSASDLQSLGLKDEREHTFSADYMPGARQGVGVRVKHLESGLSSRIAFVFGGAAPAAGIVMRVASHMAEAHTLALQHFISSDERLGRLGRANRGSAAMVDPRGVIHAASPGFRKLMAGEFGDGALTKLPFGLPEDTSGENGSFSHGALRFRAVRADGQRLLVYARKAQPLDGLSPREQEIARALSTGKTFKSVARQCGIATSTVANHASRIYRKLGIYRREELFEMIRTAGSGRQSAPP